MFEETKPRYCTRSIAEELPLELQILLWRILEQQRELHEMDYLQVFQLNLDAEGTLRMDYCQEQPAYEQSYTMSAEGIEHTKALNRKKIFVIDDETHITMLFAEEY